MDTSRDKTETTRIAHCEKITPYGEDLVENRISGHERALYKITNRGVLENRGVQPTILGERHFGISMIEAPPGSEHRPIRACDGRSLLSS